jgi:hypothetical protein
MRGKSNYRRKTAKQQVAEIETKMQRMTQRYLAYVAISRTRIYS